MTENIRGIIAMIISMAAFAAGDTIAKIVGHGMPVGQMMFIRGLFASVLCGMLAWQTGALAALPLAKSRLMLWRTIAEVTCTMAFFLGLVRMQFADVAAIGQFTPLAVTAGAALFLKEDVGWRRWCATLVGLLGVLLIIRPGSSGFQWAALLIAVAVLGVAVRDLITRCISTQVPTFLIAVISAISTCGAGLAMSMVESWSWPAPPSVALLMLAAATVTTGYYFAIVSMRTGETAVVSPFRYSAMLFALLSSLLIFGERPDAVSMLGVAIVMAAGGYTFHREQVRKRETAAAGHSAIERAA